jgi:hypothetical protein
MKTTLTKKLLLSRETVRQLTDAQLGRAAGGSDTTVDACPRGCRGTISGPAGNTCICAGSTPGICGC